MLAPVILAALYLATNLAFTVWIAREEGRGRPPTDRTRRIYYAGRYAPPAAGFAYLVTIAGDWPFFLFVASFFGFGLYLLDRLLNYPDRPPPKQ